MTLKVLSTHAVMEAIAALAPALERATGQTLSVGYDPTNVIRRRIEGGEDFDAAIVTRQALDDFAGRGIVLRATCTDLARSGLGVSVAKGARKPDIGTVEAFKRALLAAKSVVRSKDGASGAYFEALLERLGIAEAMRGKVILGPSGRVAELVAKGEADMAVQQISELLPVAGAEFAGPFPPELQHYTIFSAGAAAASRHRDAASAFIGVFVTPAATALLQANGLRIAPSPCTVTDPEDNFNSWTLPRPPTSANHSRAPSSREILRSASSASALSRFHIGCWSRSFSSCSAPSPRSVSAD